VIDLYVMGNWFTNLVANFSNHQVETVPPTSDIIVDDEDAVTDTTVFHRKANGIFDEADTIMEEMRGDLNGGR